MELIIIWIINTKKSKQYLNSLNVKLFCIQGNYEERTEIIPTYKERDMFE